MTVMPLQLHYSFSVPKHRKFTSYNFTKKKIWTHSVSVRMTASAFQKGKSMIINKEENCLRANDRDVLTNVPSNVVVTPYTDGSVFVGATVNQNSSRHIFNLGLLQAARLLSLYRFKIWWMIPRVGSAGSDIPIETQMLLVEAADTSSYVVFLPVLDAAFRSSLQGNSVNELLVCVESGQQKLSPVLSVFNLYPCTGKTDLSELIIVIGDPDVVTSESPKAVFVNCGDNPFDLMKDSMK